VELVAWVSVSDFNEELIKSEVFKSSNSLFSREEEKREVWGVGGVGVGDAS
jgi:hypothetical protein